MKFCFSIGASSDANAPAPPTAELVNSLFDAGHEVLLFAEGEGGVTEEQLARWGLRYHALHRQKPDADCFIDEQGLGFDPALAATPPAPTNDADQAAPESLLESSSYLDLVYSEQRRPTTTDYPVRLARHLLETAYEGRPGRLLDLGSGRGDALRAFAEVGFDVAGVDIAPHAPALSAPHPVEVVNLETDPLPFPRESFDAVFSKSVVEHSRQPGILLDKAREALKPGGTAVIMTPSWRHTYWGSFYLDTTHVTPFTAPSLRDALLMAGFEDVTVSHFIQLPFLWRFPWLTPPTVLLPRLLRLPFRPLDDAPWPEGMNKWIRFSREVILLAVAKKPGG